MSGIASVWPFAAMALVRNGNRKTLRAQAHRRAQCIVVFDPIGLELASVNGYLEPAWKSVNGPVAMRPHSALSRFRSIQQKFSRHAARRELR
jgi:hypothetical protein